MAIIEEGDHVIAEYPTYAPLYEIPRSLGATVDYWQLKEELNFQPDINELKALIKPNTKLICLNNASNPIGTILTKKTLLEVVKLAKEVGAYILCDEVYLPLIDTEDFVSIIDLYDKGIVTNSISKTYSFPGARIGWVASHNDEVMNKIRSLRDYTMICGGVFNDAIATFVLQHKEAILTRNKAIVTENAKIVEEWAKHESRVKWHKPQGLSTSYMQFDIPMDDETFCKDLLFHQGVLLVPGSRFDLPNGARLGYCANKETLIKGLELLSTALKQFD